jgi:hypothetical protein
MTRNIRYWIAALLSLVGATEAAEQGWPALPTTGFILGHAATEKDVADGNAIFVAKVNGVIIGRPIAITIPQYAHLTDAQGNVTPVVVVQAELANGIKMFGARDKRGKEYVATERDLRLFGTHPPN